VPSDAPHGWTVAPPNASSAGENSGASTDSSAETSGATQADTMQVQPDAAAQPAHDPFVTPASSGAQTEQRTGAHPERSNAAGVSEPGHEKGSDGGS
jgi:hypothetical protein